MSVFCPMLDLYLEEDAEDVALDDWTFEYHKIAVCYPLADTKALCIAADNIRAEHGMPRMFSGKESEMDLGGWYTFYIYVQEHDTVTDIECIVHNSVLEYDDEQSYWIPLTESEKLALFTACVEASGWIYL